MSSKIFSLALMTGLAAGAATGAHATLVYANNPAPGDAYSNASGSNQGQAIAGSDWYYNNVRNGGTVGISDANPRSGNASASFSGTAGPGGASYKADIEYLASGVAVGGNYLASGSLGAFSDFSGMSYDWYRDSASTNAAGQHPSLRILLDRDGDLSTTNDRGGLVFERAYNGGGAVPTDSWVTDVVTGTTFLWNFGLGIGNLANINATSSPFDATLAEWQAHSPNAVILGFSSGVGSGWGPFVGAVDNISWTIGGVTTMSNFELERATVPEPGSLALLGLALAGLAVARRRKGA